MITRYVNGPKQKHLVQLVQDRRNRRWTAIIDRCVSLTPTSDTWQAAFRFAKWHINRKAL